MPRRMSVYPVAIHTRTPERNRDHRRSALTTAAGPAGFPGGLLLSHIGSRLTNVTPALCRPASTDFNSIFHNRFAYVRLDGTRVRSE
jgi:hypothetical protein